MVVIILHKFCFRTLILINSSRIGKVEKPIEMRNREYAIRKLNISWNTLCIMHIIRRTMETKTETFFWTCLSWIIIFNLIFYYRLVPDETYVKNFKFRIPHHRKIEVTQHVKCLSSLVLWFYNNIIKITRLKRVIEFSCDLQKCICKSHRHDFSINLFINHVVWAQSSGGAHHIIICYFTTSSDVRCCIIFLRVYAQQWGPMLIFMIRFDVCLGGRNNSDDAPLRCNDWHMRFYYA